MKTQQPKTTKFEGHKLTSWYESKSILHEHADLFMKVREQIYVESV